MSSSAASPFAFDEDNLNCVRFGSLVVALWRSSVAIAANDDELTSDQSNAGEADAADEREVDLWKL